MSVDLGFLNSCPCCSFFLSLSSSRTVMNWPSLFYSSRSVASLRWAAGTSAAGGHATAAACPPGWHSAAARSTLASSRQTWPQSAACWSAAAVPRREASCVQAIAGSSRHEMHPGGKGSRKLRPRGNTPSTCPPPFPPPHPTHIAVCHAARAMVTK